MENVKKAFEVILKVGTKAVTAVQDDGKIDWKEGIGIGVSALGLIPVFKSLPEIKEELKNIDGRKIQVLVDLFKEQFDLPNDELEARVENGLAALANLVEMILGK